MIRVAIVSPQIALRIGLRELLSAQADLEITGEAAYHSEFELAALEADVIVLAAVTGAELRAFTATAGPALLLLSEARDEVRLLIDSKCIWGVLPLSVDEKELLIAVNALSEGLLVGAPALMQDLWARPAAVAVMDTTPLPEPLTGREIEVLQMIAQGLANKQIAAQLNISEHTVKFHLSSIYTKLGAASRTEAVRLGTRRGLVVL